MEELWELRRYVEAGDVDAALALLDEMEEMSRDDKITRIRSYMKVLLIHLIKQAVEKRTSRSQDVSIRNALDEIVTHNKRCKD
jgi:pentatricopeptide repeat protein